MHVFLPVPNVAWLTAGIAVTVLLRASLLLGLAWGIERLMHQASAAARHSLWSAILIGLLAMPLLVACLPAWHAASLPLPRRAVAPVPAALEALAPPVPTVVLPPAPTTDPVVVSPSHPPPLPDRHTRSTNLPIGTGLLLLWLAGVLIILGRTVLDALRIARTTRHATPWPDPPAVPDLPALVRILYTPDVSMPLTWGLLRPVVLLPAAARTWSPDRLRVVLLHELAHVRRRDYLLLWVTQLACALYWPNPLVWLARQRIAITREQACDDLVLQAGTQGYEYAEHLLSIARSFQDGAPGGDHALAGTVPMARTPTLKQRIRSILDPATRRHPLSFRSSLLAVGTAACVAVPLAALDVGPAGAPDGPSPPPSLLEQAASPPALPTSAAEPDTTPVPHPAATYLWMDPETTLLKDPMDIARDAEAAGGRYVWVPDHLDDDEGEPAAALFHFEVAVPGVYVVWGRILSPHDNDNSFYVTLDDGDAFIWDTPGPDPSATTERWQWSAVRPRAGAPTADAATDGPARFTLEAGPHTLRIHNREDGTRLDRVLVTDDLAYTPDGKGPPLLPTDPVYAWFEAEQGLLTAPLRRASDDEASGRQFIRVDGDRDSKDHPPENGYARYPFTLNQPGTFVAWGRVIAPGDEHDSFWVRMDDGPWRLWNGIAHGRDWHWDAVHHRDRDARQVVRFDLTAGAHRLDVAYREEGTRLDRLLVTNDLAYAPYDAGVQGPPPRPAYLWLEAEDGTLTDPLRQDHEAEASGGRYIRAEGGRNSRDDPPPDGRARYRFRLNETDVYVVWGRVRAHDGDENSFWVRLDDGPWIRWNDIVRSRDWRWDQVLDDRNGDQVLQARLEAGEHTLDVAYREEGTRLDGLLITNDHSYVPGAESETERVVVVVRQ